LRVVALRLRQLQEQILAQRIALGRGQRRIQRSPIQLIAQVRPVALDVNRHIAASLGR
jgi:hypothetical protein